MRTTDNSHGVHYTAMQQVLASTGTFIAGLHVLFALWLLFNVLFNHALCVFTDPGCTLDVDAEVRWHGITWGGAGVKAHGALHWYLPQLHLMTMDMPIPCIGSIVVHSGTGTCMRVQGLA